MTIKKNVIENIKVGIRTINDSAEAPHDYEKVDTILDIADAETHFEISIVALDDWQPDKSFLVELYDPSSGAKLQGGDTRVKVTVIDEDSAGILSFEDRHVKVRRKDEKITIRLQREDGADCDAVCKVRTELLRGIDNQAQPDEDYVQKVQRIVFEKGVTEQVFEVKIKERNKDKINEVKGTITLDDVVMTKEVKVQMQGKGRTRWLTRAPTVSTNINEVLALKMSQHLEKHNKEAGPRPTFEKTIIT